MKILGEGRRGNRWRGRRVGVIVIAGLLCLLLDLVSLPISVQAKRLSNLRQSTNGLQDSWENPGNQPHFPYSVTDDIPSFTFVWSSRELGYISSLAWGDYDGDGDLDLVTGNEDAPNHLYRNDAGQLTPNAVWSSRSLNARGVDWGDYDGDGDLDLAVANYGWANYVYRNDGGQLTSTAVWSSSELEYTELVVWGDYDGDGDLDLVVGNENAADRLYRNDEGQLTTSAVWSSLELDDTYNLAWGDYDGDGDLDLATGANRSLWWYGRFYRNDEGQLTTSAIWSIVTGYNTTWTQTLDVAWGDYDSDGDLDLVVGDCLYRNEEGELTDHAVWWPSERGIHEDIDWGDYDSDGDPDLAISAVFFDDYGVPSVVMTSLYLNDGGQLTTNPVWSANGYGVAWKDYDNDGDLDLIVGTTLYRNDGGTFTASPLWSGEPGSHGGAWGDYDGDGDLDLATGKDGYGSYLYRNDGGLMMPNSVWSSDESAYIHSSAWGDYDNDGDLDLVVGKWGNNRLYRNIGGQLASSPVWLSSESENTHDVAWGDYDGDGDLDLVTGNSGSNYLYRNDGGMLTASAVWSSAEGASSVAWGDYDSDGDLDLAAGTRLYRNDGGILTNNVVWSGASDGGSAAWGDYDGDGDLDLVAGGAGPNLYQNNAGLLTDSAVWSSSESDNALSVAWGDFDRDGDLDLAVGDTDAPDRLYRNDGGMLTSSAVWASSKSGSGIVAWGDYDGDGDLDLAVGIKEGGVGLYRNDASPLIAEGQLSGNAKSIAWGDYDGDGDLDLVEGGTSGCHLHRNDNGKLTSHAVWSAFPGWSASVAWGDYDGDGDLDLGIGVIGSNNCLYRNMGGELTTSPIWSSDDYGYTQSIAWGDYDGDGDLDLAVGNEDAPNCLYRNDEGQLTTRAVWSSGESDDTESVAWGDYDGDGDLDLVTGSWKVGALLYRNDEGQLTTGAVWSSGESDNTESVAWGDYDGDGDLDLVVGGTPNRLYRNDEGQLTTNAVWSSSESENADSLAWGDYDGDGDLDLVVGGTPNRLYRNDKGQLIASAVWSSSELEDTISVAWGDYDGDGDLDLAAGNLNDIRLYRNTRDAQLTPFPVPIVQISRPFPPADAYSVAKIWHEQTIAIPYTLFHRDNSPVQRIIGLYSLNGGGQWLPAVATGDTLTRNLDTASYTDHSYFTLTANPIPDVNTLSSTLTISESAAIADIDVVLNLIHTWDSDLVITLTTPFSRSALLVNRRGGGGDNFTNTIFDDDATTSIISGTAPFIGHYRPEQTFSHFVGYSANGEWMLSVSDLVTGNVGTLLSWGMTVTLNSGAVHTYTWDVYESGFIAQRDNVVFRLTAIPAIENSPNQIPGPYLYGSYASHTFPFRVWGSQVRVLSDTVPAENALVYRLPVSQTISARPYVSLSGKPLHTDEQGYLQGWGEIRRGDRLFAMLPIAWTDSYTLYYTSGDPTLSGLDFYTVTALGVQTLTVSSANPLLLFDLDVSLEWDARNDEAYLAQLDRDLDRTSQVLYDLSNGQMALGQVNVYQAKEHWMEAHVVVYASNSVRPNANLGGIVSEGIDEISTSGVITDAYVPGQVRIGATWNRFGNTSGNLGEDWPRVLAHELSHYLLFLEDNYLGLSTEGFLIHTDCQGSAMTDPYSDAYSEYLTADAWTGECLDTLAEHTVGRADWKTIDTFYPMVNAIRTNSGPNDLPLAVTQITFAEIVTPANTLAAPFFSLIDAAGRPLDAGQASGYLFKTQGTADPTDDHAIALGAPNRDLLQARGAAPGDRLCVFDEGHTPARLGCLDPIGDYEAAVTLHEVPGWQPQVRITPVTSRTFMITVTQVAEAALNVQFLPDDGPASNPIAMNPLGSDFVQTITLDEPAFSGYARVWVPGSDPHKETVVEFFLGDGWGARKRAWSARKRAWSARKRAWSAPVVSGDGQVTVFDLDNILGGVEADYTLQTLASLQTLPDWLTPVGHAYRFSAGDVPARGSILFWYLQRDVPEGQEYDLHIYYSPDEGQTWERLDTNLDDYRNMASASVQGEGIYVLISAIALPSFSEGWNNFGYPVPGTRPITTALASIAGKYTSIYEYRTEWIGTMQLSRWWLYDQTVVEEHPEFSTSINDLSHFEFGRGYWLYATEPITLYLGVSDVSPMQFNGLQLPPATFYGWVIPTDSFAPTVGMSITAWIGETQCGTTTVTPLNGRLAYKLQVISEDATPNNCGTEGRDVIFKVGERQMVPGYAWDNSQAWFHNLSNQAVEFDIYLPLVLRQY